MGALISISLALSQTPVYTAAFTDTHIHDEMAMGQAEFTLQ